VKPGDIVCDRTSCDQCTALMINGVFCHETGCPNSRKVYRDGEWVKVYHCIECGCEVEDGEACCLAESEEVTDEPVR
jgi:hypothetical protein